MVSLLRIYAINSKQYVKCGNRGLNIRWVNILLQCTIGPPWALWWHPVFVGWLNRTIKQHCLTKVASVFAPWQGHCKIWLQERHPHWVVMISPGTGWLEEMRGWCSLCWRLRAPPLIFFKTTHALHGSMLIHGGVAIHIPRALTTSLFRTQSSVYMTPGQINFILCLVYW